MPIFVYLALDKRQQVFKGAIAALNLNKTLELLQTERIEVIHVWRSNISDVLTDLQLSNWFQMLNQFLEYGLPFVDSLKLMQTSLHDLTLYALNGSIAHDLYQGSTLSVSLQSSPIKLPALAVKLMVAGITTGNLVDITKQLNKFYENRHQYVTALTQKTRYPILALTSAIILSIIGIIYLNIVTYNDSSNNHTSLDIQPILVTTLIFLGTYFFRSRIISYVPYYNKYILHETLFINFYSLSLAIRHNIAIEDIIHSSMDLDPQILTMLKKMKEGSSMYNACIASKLYVHPTLHAFEQSGDLATGCMFIAKQYRMKNNHIMHLFITYSGPAVLFVSQLLIARFVWYAISKVSKATELW